MRKFRNKPVSPETPIRTRSFSVEPTTADEKTRTIQIIAATEAPVMMPDWQRGEMVPETLLMSGLRIPADKSLPMQDCHRMQSVFNTLGSVRDLHTTGQNLEGTAHFSDDDDGKKAFAKAKGGHVRAFSVGYQIFRSVYVPEKETQRIDGRDFSGPVRIVTDWEAFEVSLVPAGADPNAKARDLTNGNASANRAEISKGGSFRMNERLKLLLIQRGLAQGSTDEEALAFLLKLSAEDQKALRSQAGIAEATVVVTVTDPKTLHEAEERARLGGIRQEADRQKEIRSMCQVPGCESMAEELCSDPKITIDQARARIIERMKTDRQPVGARITPVLEERDKFRSAAMDGVELRAGIRIEKPAPGATEIRGMSLLRLAEECLLREGKPSRFYDPSELVARAMTTSDFPLILANSANKKMQNAYLEAPETFAVWTEPGEGRDFKDMTRPQLSEASDLQLVNENGEENLVAFKEFAPSFAIKTYDAATALTRQMVINDDLSAFLRVPVAFGRACPRKIGDLVYALITNNTSINTTDAGALALFVAGHANLLNPALPLGIDSLTEMRRMLRVQTGRAGKGTLGLRLAFLLVPAALETTTDVIANSVTYPEKTAGPLINPFQGKFTPVVEHRLDANSTTAHYGIADWRDGVGTVEVAYLNGVQNPTMQRYDGTNPDVQKFRVRIDVGVGLKDHRGMVKSAGA